MLTPQEVSTHAFTKAVMGGYNMAMVDEFLDELTEDYTSLYKENATLKAKLKVLVEKVEDYRATEDSMRATLLTAQKMADSIVHEAESKRDSLLAQTDRDAQTRRDLLQQELTQLEERIRLGQQELARFIAASREICAKEIQFLDQLPQLPVGSPAPLQAPETAPPVRQTEDAPQAAAAADAPDEVEPAAPETVYPEGDPFAQGDALEATRRIDLDDLKFGRNYKGGK